jgi:enoyl-CoA hydratase/carnithine racemase
VSGSWKQIRFDVDGPTAVITMSRPERLNAFTPIMRREMGEALDLANADDAIRAVIVTGEGRAFCAGADLGGNGGDMPAFTYTGADQVDDVSAPEKFDGIIRDGGGILTLQIASSRKPIIAAVNGPAVGVGATMTLPMDIRIASDRARFGFVFARRGIVPEAASTWFLPRIVGISQALEWSLTGSLVDAEAARRARLVSHVVPHDRLMDVAKEIALEIAENTSAVAVAATRQMLWSELGQNSPWHAHLTETTVIQELKLGPDAAEGRASFLDKRAPHFSASPQTEYPTTAPRWPRRPGTMAEVLGSQSGGDDDESQDPVH